MIDHIVRLIVEEAHKRKGNLDMISKIYTVHIEIKEEISKILDALRECERVAKEGENFKEEG